MRLNILFNFILLSGVLFLFGCSLNSNGDMIIEPPHCTVLNSVDSYEYQDPQITFTVINDGEGSKAYNIFVNVKLKRGGFIVDEAWVSFDDLEKGESRSEQTHFFKVKSHSEYTSREVKLTWADDMGGYYD